ncbi:MAG TPA: ATP-binding protein [Gemmatimonadaceae bacterium]|nr:ATP-binding protein [Gemmatimonadaceae bacterium]
MDAAASPPTLSELAAKRLCDSRMELTARWLERIVARVSVPPERVFPTDDLLDHMPLLIEGIAKHLADPSDPISGNGGVVDRARELGALRYTQGFSEHQLQKEYELLGGVLHAFLQRVTLEAGPHVTTLEALECAHRLFQAIALIQQATTSRFLEHATLELSEREERLQAFHRALTHEIRNRVGATLGAGQLLQFEGLEAGKRSQLAEVVVRNALGMRVVLDNLLELSRVRVASRRQRNVRLAYATAEAVRQLREAAARQRVTVSVADDLPDVEVNAAAVELCLTNLISNGIKYANPKSEDRWVEVRSHLLSDENDVPIEVVVEVADNGLGVPVGSRTRLFERFFRAHESQAPSIEGTGLGLNIVRDVLRGINGRVWAEFPEVGSVFAFSMPCRRSADRSMISEASERAEA